MPNIMLHVPDPENVRRLLEFAAKEMDAKLVPIHIKNDYEPRAYCGALLTDADRWEFNQTWELATCELCLRRAVGQG